MPLDSPGNSQVTESLTDTRRDILKLVAGMGGLNVPQSQIINRLDMSRQGVTQNIKKLCKLGLLEREKRGRSVFLNILKDSLPVIFSDSPDEIRGGHGVQVLDSSGKVSGKGDLEDGMVRVHNVVVSFEFQEQYKLGEKKERWVQSDLHNWKYSESEDRYIGYKSGNQVRVTRSKVFFHLGDKVGWDIDELKRDLMDEAFETALRFEKNSDITLKRGRGMGLKITVEKQHIAMVGEPLGRYIDRETSMDVTNFKVRSEDGRVIYEWDRSEGPLEVESKNWAFTEDAIRNLREFWKAIGEYEWDPRELSHLGDLYRVTDRVKRGMDVLKSEVERHSKKSQELEERLSRKSNKSEYGRRYGEEGMREVVKERGLYDYNQDELENFRDNYF